MQNTIRCDVLIVGGGAAATRAAIEAKDNGADVLIATKRKYGYSGSSFYVNSIPWGIMRAGGGIEAQKKFLEEILSASCGCLNSKLTEILVRDSDDRFQDLVDYGLKFRNNDDIPCFGREPRGALLISMDNARQCFKDQIRKRNIKVAENLHICDLIVKDNICCGAIGIDEEGNWVKICSKTVILASGGAEYLWEYGFANADMTGDAYAMAARNGARLTNLEFIQFIPGIISPLQKTNFHHPTLESIPLIYNKHGEEFLEKYLPENVTVEDCLKARAKHGPFSYEDESKYFDIAICMEAAKTGDNKAVGAEIRYRDELCGKFAVWNDFLKSRGVDPQKDALTIYPHCQGFNGGVAIDEQCSTDIENLYACGECAGGPHGANRIGGNAVLGTQVFGKIAGEQAARKAMTAKAIEITDTDALFKIGESFDTGYTTRITPEEIMKNIKSTMQESAFIIRDETNLRKGIEKIEAMQKEFNPCQFIKDGDYARKALNAYNSLSTARLILYSMLNRKESRGSHYRKDFPNRNNKEYGKMVFIRLNKDNDIFIE
ncbi:MAG TPA: FAD-binding protein [Clostridiaceae bacterium]|nr:FAD-binding protein [Clostridiaceae bacterium]